ncbi:SUMF1/EgtB/PvdO family nonheme iron enzyme [Pseudovibrio sp. Tun.PSC04-5.I4]|uniref:formylglycine-generating enzyme family protein n=1 Tax=Pseudovibrio sp. Tun.PSC04-5.I4 TaxID=1798213 RepID=UPI00088DD725|nr:SUMF1/EgtB/PvdO family nonheme iron enzyme [Pseudovibrio sp. Tun.PSC04-5.I4]SDQ14778.1 Formylglycine-generating enzyme, required for sulfatase activity, contains SUMF1/FGE domain [Pseudovibrio sp. Tun.PSC04-5.I4]
MRRIIPKPAASYLRTLNTVSRITKLLVVSSPFIFPTSTLADKIEAIKDCATCPELRLINGGEYTIGLTKYEKYHRRDANKKIRVQNYYIGTYEVTLDEYFVCVEEGICDAPDVKFNLKKQGKQPVMAVSWKDAVTYAAFLTQRTGRKYRLPSEVEWEFAASARTETRYWWGNEASHDFMNYGQEPSGGLLKPPHTDWKEPANVGSYPPNPYELYDMNGNAAEWVSDCDDRKELATTGKAAIALYPDDASPILPMVGQICGMRVVKGGSYLNADYYARNRFGFAFFDGGAELSAVGLGFRVASDKR